MLVIRRRPGQSVLIGDDIEIEIIESGPSRVKLGIRAPQSVPVMRGEVRQTRAENLAASRTLDAVAPGEIAAVLGAARL
jgi:carbon storage regulator